MEVAMKNILLFVHDDIGQEARFQAALDLTRALNGHLTCLDVALPPLALGGDYYSAAGQGVLIDMEREREARNKSDIESRLRNEGVSWNWLDTLDTIPHAIIDAAALADLIVLNRKLDTYRHPDMLDVTSRVLLHGRKPVVAMPEEAERLALGRALIAWDGQSSCAATVRACVPLLQLADAVELFMVRDGTERTDPAEAAEYLSRHGIHADIRIVDDGLTSADDLILEEAINWNADYIMMGAYGRGRLMETFGGVTKRMLASSKFPLILGH
jgi:nucleotide-binding universal stress UspA family protein